MSDEELARKSAHILGESSAAARALVELERRRAAGETVEIFNHQQSWIVGPPLESAGDPPAPQPLQGKADGISP